ncbi:MAG TPA: aldehyde dehydrogenase family protein [Desulfobacterales bacterium]|nr:aldehyde dehydrogenase family protein [Desulfobacterales bacterium]
MNPAHGTLLCEAPVSSQADMDLAIHAAEEAFQDWRNTPPVARARYLHRLIALMEENFNELSITQTLEHGKTIDESRGETRRGIEMLEVASGIPSLMQGFNLEDIAHGIDEVAFYQPMGVFGCIAPFNFPLMVPLWFLPFAIACGNTFVVKSSPRTPMSQAAFFKLLDEVGLPPGVASLVNGETEGAKLKLDGRRLNLVGDLPEACFLNPTVLESVQPDMTCAMEEIFGPVACVLRAKNLEEAIDIIHRNPYGNAASIFTNTGKWARQFRHEVVAGNVGINVGIAAPMSFFPFGGRKDSFFGVVHGQGRDVIRFFTEPKIVIERWF